ncbi:MAG: radical SAM protein [Deltaproteobacteria bacterium]|nr:MAG: radical SAM protein [Deltaproteobacteria bacterium]
MSATVVKLGTQWFEYADVLVDVMIGYACNVQCDYCSVTDEMRKENMATAPVMAALAEARRRGATKVSFGGGEPTIRRSLLPLVRWCRDRGYRSIKIPSNGLMYSYRSFAEEACDAGITDFHISFMAHTEELYTRIMGRPDALSLVTQGVRNLKALGRKPVGDLIIKHDTWMHLADIVEHWAGFGIDTFNLWLVSLSDRNRDNLESLPMVSEMRPGIEAAFDRGKRLGVTVRSRHIPRCMLPGYEDHVVDLREDKVLVVTPRATFALWESRISPNTYAEKCNGCRYQYGSCLGERRDYLERWGDAELRPALEPVAAPAA